MAVAVSGAKRVRQASPPPQVEEIWARLQEGPDHVKGGATSPYEDPLLVAETPATTSAMWDSGTSSSCAVPADRKVGVGVRLVTGGFWIGL